MYFCVLDCQLPKEVGPCKASMRVYFFDVKISRCAMFIYGGCQGNGNNFDKMEDCQKTCGKQKKLKHKKTERQRDRETERQRDRETERQRDRETERQRDRETERQRGRVTKGW